MKLTCRQILKCLIATTFSGAMLGLASCAKSVHSSSSQTYRIPWPNEAGELKLQNIEIDTLSDPEHFGGSTAKILVEPSDGGGQLAGANPVGRYVRTTAGVVVPADYVTLQAVTAYAHIERLHDIDEKAGAAQFLSWPLSIGLNVNVVAPTGLLKNNAIFDAKLNSLLIVPYTEGDLPMPFNAGILAHEHFHFIFQSVVLSRVKDIATQTSCSGAAPVTPGMKTIESTPCTRILDSEMAKTCQNTAAAVSKKIFNSFVLRGMNEGFADFWGWNYSHDEFFISKSLPSELNSRRLDWGSGRLPSEQLIRENLVDTEHPDKPISDDERTHEAYVLGSQYARFLRHAVSDLARANSISENEAGEIVARALVQSLPAISDLVAAGFETSYLSPNMLFKPLVLALPKVPRDFCDRVDRFHANDDGYEKPASCGGDAREIILPPKGGKS